MDSESSFDERYTLTFTKSSWQTPQWKYDVYLNSIHEDPDRHGKTFTDHLYTTLAGDDIHTFRADGFDQLPPSVNDLEAIEGSNISIVIFSKEYASSRSCLDKLVKIMDCKKSIGQLVLPVFHHVDPSDVRKQSGSFEAAFINHEHEDCFDPEKIKQWRVALTEAGNLAGWDIQDDINGWYAEEFIKDIVIKVVQRLKRNKFVVKHPVGLHSRLLYLKNLVAIFGQEDVGVVGIYGMGGIGKTTIAKEFYNEAILHYEHTCFLENVRQESKQFDGLVRLQERLLSALKGKNHRVTSVDQGIDLIKERLGCRRVLVVLDDVDHLTQIDSLIGESLWFGKGSLIIMTTRDEHLLDQAKVDYKYEINELNNEESLMLFNWHAFKSPIPLESFKNILEDIVKYAGRLPLALEVLGSSLYNKTMEEWKNMLEELKQFAPDDVLERLRISFDTLDDTEKDIFLDIACFFNGAEKEFAIKIFDGCGFFGAIGISTLVDRCLLKVDMDDRVKMHDLVQDMGRKVVWEKFPQEPGKRTRLWLQDDVCNVLIKNEVTEAIEGMILDLSTQSRFSTRPFSKMPNLRLLQINNIDLVGSFRGLFKELRWLCWHRFPLESLPMDFHPEKLISLDMQKSNLHVLWRHTKFLGCSSLESLPEQLGDWKGLREINASGTRIQQLPDSIGMCELISLSITDCSTLKSLPNSICKMKTLNILRLTDCSNIQELPDELGDLERLEDIGVSGTSIKRLPDSIQQIPYLHTLLLNNCKTLESLPGRNLGLSLIRVLALRDCNLSDNDFPNDMWNLSGLMVLDLSNNNFSSLPSGLSQLYNLQVLYAGGCKSLLKLPDVSGLEVLRVVDLKYCSKLVEIMGLENLSSLQEIYLDGCSSLSMVMDNFFLQGYGRGLCDSKFYVSRRGIPDWFEFQGVGKSSMLIDTDTDTPSSVEDGSLHLMIWVDYFFGDDGDKFFHIGVRVDSKTSGVKWDCEITGRQSVESCMVLGPMIKSGDIIEVSFELEAHREDVKVEKFGVHLLPLPINNCSPDVEVTVV
ncbi:unnamed protein product [Lactuca saligna]|uniref:TIR domain-containing protein n=1 Tax=Lactuca saligna TaxID=75948 RepID=A0AA35YGC4_LACSI|nr:unnamed protein product [Lactuca saligna]